MEKTFNELLREKYEEGFKLGMQLMKERLKIAAENGSPIEIDGRAWYLKSDIENLRDIMEDLENGR